MSIIVLLAVSYKQLTLGVFQLRIVHFAALVRLATIVVFVLLVNILVLALVVHNVHNA